LIDNSGNSVNRADPKLAIYPSYLVSRHVFCKRHSRIRLSVSVLSSFQRVATIRGNGVLKLRYFLPSSSKTSSSTILEISLKTIGCVSRKWQLTGLEDLTQIKGREIFLSTTCPRILFIPLGPSFFPASFYKLGESPLTRVPTRVSRPKHLPSYTVEEGIKKEGRRGEDETEEK